VAKRNWKMPEWMEPYRDLFENTGGNSVEELMDHEFTNANIVRGTLAVCVESQVILLRRLRAKGLLTGVPTEEVPRGS
jgi:hypothetical protein